MPIRKFLSEWRQNSMTPTGKTIRRWIGALRCEECDRISEQAFTWLQIRRLENPHDHAGRCQHCGGEAPMVSYYQEIENPPPVAKLFGWATAKTVNNFNLPKGTKVAVMNCPNPSCKNPMGIVREQAEMSGWHICAKCSHLFRSRGADGKD